MVLVVASLTLTANQSPPPAIAELAPSAIEQIKDPPPEQSSELGSGDGGGLGGLTTTTTSTTTTVLGGPTTTSTPPQTQPRVHRCVGQPPRQTEDPQSPPCVTWTGTDNGGATSKGVTAGEIRVAVPTPDGVLSRHYTSLQAFFNQRYELYGRKLRLVAFKHKGDNVDCAAMKADAINAAEQIDAFASLGYSIQRGAEGCYYDELARRGVMSMQGLSQGVSSGGEAHMERFAPYQWSFFPSVDKIQRLLGEMICKNLAGRPPVHADGAQRAASVRKFGILREIPRRGAPPLDTSILDGALRSCGVTPVRIEQDTNVDDGARQALARSAVIKFSDENVTSVVCLCEAAFLGGLLIYGSIQGFFPEWILQDYQGQDFEAAPAAWPSEDQKDNQLFGIRTWNKALPRAQTPYWMAQREADPTYPEGPYNNSTPYADLLVLGSGIQMAGPKLTPQAFQDGIYNASFPNPGCGGPPVYQGCVDFGPGNHTMVQDGTLIWFDPVAAPRDFDSETGPRRYGGFCYVENGRRYRPGQIPSGQLAFFQGPCA